MPWRHLQMGEYFETVKANFIRCEECNENYFFDFLRHPKYFVTHFKSCHLKNLLYRFNGFTEEENQQMRFGPRRRKDADAWFKQLKSTEKRMVAMQDNKWSEICEQEYWSCKLCSKGKPDLTHVYEQTELGRGQAFLHFRRSHARTYDKFLRSISSDQPLPAPIPPQLPAPPPSTKTTSSVSSSSSLSHPSTSKKGQAPGDAKRVERERSRKRREAQTPIQKQADYDRRKRKKQQEEDVERSRARRKEASVSMRRQEAVRSRERRRNATEEQKAREAARSKRRRANATEEQKEKERERCRLRYERKKQQKREAREAIEWSQRNEAEDELEAMVQGERFASSMHVNKGHVSQGGVDYFQDRPDARPPPMPLFSGADRPGEWTRSGPRTGRRDGDSVVV